MTNNTMVAFYATKDLAKDAFAKLQQNGIDTKSSSIVITKHEILKNNYNVKMGKFMLLLHGTPTELNPAAALLGISIENDVVQTEGADRVLSGGETSSFQ